MKKLLLTMSLVGGMFALPTAFAGEPCTTCGNLQLSRDLGQTQAQETTSTSTAQQGNEQNINFNSPGQTDTNVHYSGTQKIKNVPSVSGPPLTTSNDTCMGSTSGSVNIAGLGIGGGSTWTDANCKRLKNARELWNMGMKAAGMELMCLDDENRKALLATGYACSPTEREKQEAARKEQAARSIAVSGPSIAPSGADVTTSPIVGY